MQRNPISLSQSLKIESKEPGDLKETLKRIARTAQKYFAAHLCVIFPINPLTGDFLREPPMVVGKLTKARLKDFQYPRKDGVTKKILKERILPLEKIPKEYTSPVTDLEGIKSFLGVGLYTEKHRKPLAVIYLDYRKSRKFNREFLNDLNLFSEIASAELQTTWFLRRYSEIARIGQDINENFENIDQMFEKVFEHMKGILDVGYYFSLVNYDLRRNHADLYLVDEGKKAIKKDFPLANSVSAWVINNLKTKTFDNIDKAELPEGVKLVHVDGTATKEKSAIFVPIKINNKPLGAISVQHPRVKYFDNEDTSILELLANHIALALNNFRLLNDLQDLDKAGQKLTEKLDAGDEIVSEVVDSICEATQADLITLYQYIQSQDRYLSPIDRGEFLDPSSLKKGEATTAAIVHLVNAHDKPVFAEDSTQLYSTLGKDYLSGGRFPQIEKVKSTIAIPLKAGAEPIGVLFINYRSKQRFDRAQQWVTNSLASYAAIAIRNSRRIQELRLRRLKELEDLRQIDRAISQILDRDKILQTILELTIGHIKADTGVMLLHNKKSRAIEAKAAIGTYSLPLEQQIYELDQFKGIAKTAFERKRTIRIGNVREDPEWKDKFIEISQTTLSEMDVPLILENEAIGVMNFESARENAFSDDDQSFMETLAGQAVIAIKNATEYEAAQRIAKEREALIDIVNTLLSQTDEKEIFSIILRKALEITETDKGTINTCNEDRREIKVEVDRGLKPEWKNGVQTFEQGVIGRAAREKRFIKIDRVSTDPLREEFLDAFPGIEESELVVPILDGNKVIGVINLESENPYHFEDDDVELVKSLASLCAVAIKNAENINQKQLASIGIITGDLSHKMKSPLSKIQRQIELIELKQKDELDLNPDLASRLKQIASVASEATEMVQLTLDEAKGKFVSIERTSLSIMLNSALADIEMPENVHLDDKISESDFQWEVYASRQLTNVFHNLITNSINAMPPEGGTIYAEVEKADTDWVIISIEDTGKGIPPDEAELVFLPISSSGLEGRGFGLSLTKQYIEMIGGKILPPTPGRSGIGTKFSIYLRPYPSST